MKLLGELRTRWSAFFFEPRSPLPIACFRILFGVLVLLQLLALYPDLRLWFGRSPPRLFVRPNLEVDFLAVSSTSELNAVWLVLIAAALLLTIGLFTRFASVVVYLGLLSMYHDNAALLNGGDTLIRAMSFFLMFSNAGAALSVDRVIQIRRGRPDPAAIPRAPVAERLMQLQLAWVYLCTAVWKIESPAWRQGTMIYYVLNIEGLRRYALPVLSQSALLTMLATWATVVIEGALGVLVWVPRLRYYVLGAGVCMHLAMDLLLDIPFFQWSMLVAYVLFVDARDLEALGEWCRRGSMLIAGRCVPRSRSPAMDGTPP